MEKKVIGNMHRINLVYGKRMLQESIFENTQSNLKKSKLDFSSWANEIPSPSFSIKSRVKFLSSKFNLYKYQNKREREREYMEVINHFSHKKHPLKLIQLETVVLDDIGGADGGGGREIPEVIGCYACTKPISSGFAYGCIECHHFMHKACAQLPLTVNLPSLYHQPLELLDPGKCSNWSCHVCYNKIKTKTGGFGYVSFNNDQRDFYFNVCIDCFVIEIARKAEADAINEKERIKKKHESHPHHTLTLRLRPATFNCDACKTKDEGLLYICDSCDFWIHKTCASLDPTLNLPNHPDHPLRLVYSLPENFFKFAFYCNFCGIYIRRNEWLYHCPDCRYFAHIKCALDAQKPSTPRDAPSTSNANEDGDDLLHFPMSIAFTDPLRLHFDNLGQDYDKKIKINHWSHHHPLVLTVDPQDNMSGGLIDVCQGCVKPLSPPYYSCKDGCSFTLHIYCAGLPLELKHQLHPDHSLVLKNMRDTGFFYHCDGCFSNGNMFFYVCETCGFYLDVNCAFLPNTIKHKSHEHSLIQVIDSKPICNACNKICYGFSYTCKACNFTLSMYCAMRSPLSLVHRYCKGHEIPFTYPPIKDHPEDFFCEICEMEMDPMLPHYYCNRCKTSFHCRCISRVVYYENIFIAGTVTVSFHKHPLTFARRKKTPRYVCSNCNHDINGYSVLECRAKVCNFTICFDCCYEKFYS